MLRFLYVLLILSCFLPVALTARPLALDNSRPAKQKTLLINGAGASFPYILYSKWFLEYKKAHPHILINYRSIGSGGGIRQFLTGTLDFGATDVPMPTERMQKAGKPVLHLPTALGAVVVSYNLPSLKNTELRFTARLLADIYMKKITKWNHPQIQEINPGVDLPDRTIVPIYRADGSGTTAVFTEYLSLFSEEWLSKSGKGKAVNWLTGMGGKGNEGVMGLIQKIPGAIGYVAMSYAVHRGRVTAQIQNRSGHFVKATVHTVKNAAKQMLIKTNDWFQPLTTAVGESAYPLSSYTYLLVHTNMDSEKGRAFVRFLDWYLKTGQSFCEQLHYVPLPRAVIKAAQHKVQSIKVGGDDKKT